MARKTPTERLRKSKAEKAAENAAGLTIAERLTRSSQSDRINIMMHDEDGDFVLEMREPLSSERILLQKAISGFEGKTAKQQEKAESKFAKLLEEFSIDESLDKAFWMRGGYTPSKLQYIILELLGVSLEKVRQAKETIKAKSFRDD